MQHRPFIMPRMGRIRYIVSTYDNGLIIKRRYRKGRLLSKSYSIATGSELYNIVKAENE